jgi:hypothetical protein
MGIHRVASATLISPFDCAARTHFAWLVRKHATYVFAKENNPDGAIAWDSAVIIENVIVSERSEVARTVGFQTNLFERRSFGKISWSCEVLVTPERALLQEDLEYIVSGAFTPCIPMRHLSVDMSRDCFQGTLGYKNIDASIKGARIVRLASTDGVFARDCLDQIPMVQCAHRAPRKEILACLKKHADTTLLGAANATALVSRHLDLKTDTLHAAKHVEFVFTEWCGETTLYQYLMSGTKASEPCEILQLYFMLFHALSMLAAKGVSHNDLHSNNVMVRRVTPTMVSFGNYSFVTTIIPFIIDWDFGRSETVSNPELMHYAHVGIFDTQNVLFDVFGLVKTFLYHFEGVYKFKLASNAVIKSEEAQMLARTLAELFSDVRNKHAWLFYTEYTCLQADGDGKIRNVKHKCVQQTPYVVPGGGGRIDANWPDDVFTLAPTFREIGEALFERFAIFAHYAPPSDMSPKYTFPDFWDANLL